MLIHKSSSILAETLNSLMKKIRMRDSRNLKSSTCCSRRMSTFTFKTRVKQPIDSTMNRCETFLMNKWQMERTNWRSWRRRKWNAHWSFSKEKRTMPMLSRRASAAVWSDASKVVAVSRTCQLRREKQGSSIYGSACGSSSSTEACFNDWSLRRRRGTGRALVSILT